MPPSRDADDATSAAGTSIDETSVIERSNDSILTKLFKRCEKDAMASVHRAWAAAVMFMVLFFVMAIIEGEPTEMRVLTFVLCRTRAETRETRLTKNNYDTANKLREDVTSTRTLQVAAYYSAAIHLILVILGTFVLKRFATAFTVGSFLGVTLVLSQQNLLMFAAFFKYGHGDHGTNLLFANLSFMLFLCLGFFSAILGHFKDEIIVL